MAAPSRLRDAERREEVGRHAPLSISPDSFSRIAVDELPSRASVRERDLEIDYDVEEVNGAPVGVARLP